MELDRFLCSGLFTCASSLSWGLLNCWLANCSDKLHEIFIPRLDKCLHTSGLKSCITKFNFHFLLKLMYGIPYIVPSCLSAESLKHSQKTTQEVCEHVKSECIWNMSIYWQKYLVIFYSYIYGRKICSQGGIVVWGSTSEKKIPSAGESHWWTETEWPYEISLTVRRKMHMYIKCLQLDQNRCRKSKNPGDQFWKFSADCNL